MNQPARIFSLVVFGVAILLLPGRAAAQSASGNVWSTMAPMPTARLGVAAAVNAQGSIYAVGGFNGGPLNTVEVYNPATNSWITAASMPEARHVSFLESADRAARGPRFILMLKKPMRYHFPDQSQRVMGQI